MTPLAWLGLLVGGGFLATLSTAETVAGAVKLAGRGKRLTRDEAGADGVVARDPAAIAADMGASLDECALARMLSSEEGSKPVAYKQAIAWVTRNEAEARGVSVSALLLKAKNADHDGRFGAQADLETSSAAGVHPSDRYASTRFDAYEDDLAVARDVLTGNVDDPTDGAVQFDSPKVQDQLFAAGKTSRNADAVAKSRTAEGKELVVVEGIPERDLRFWREKFT